MRQQLFSVMFSAIAAMSFAGFVSAESLPAPTGPVILTVTGDIETTNVAETLQFDIASLKSLDETVIETTTIWTEGLHKFQGVSLAKLKDVVGMESGTFFAKAINDYTIEIPVSDAAEGGPIIAYLMDDEEMSIRHKGPLWVIYPYDSSPNFRSEVIYARSIWQLDRIEVVQ